jgi:hypothetical protein
MNTLAESLSSRVKGGIFRLLFGAVPRELHVREIERQSGLADATVRQELKRLSRLGVVESRPKLLSGVAAGVGRQINTHVFTAGDWK